MRWRDPVFVALSGALLLAAVLCGLSSSRWVGRPFAGFLLLENRVVASAGLARWPGTAGGEIYQRELYAVDGRPLASAEALSSYVETLPVGTPVHYQLRSGAGQIDRVIATRLFTGTDWALLFGLYLLNGLAVGGVALCIWLLRGNDRVSRGTVIPLWHVALWALTASDLYGPYHWFRIHAWCEGLLFAGAVHVALVFPRPARWVDEHPLCLAAPYLLAIPLAIAIQWGLATPSIYVVTHAIATTAFGVALVALIGSQLAHFLRSPSFEVRQRIKVVALGTALALGPQALLALGATLSGGRTPQNLMAFTGALFPVSIGYALVRQNLLGVDELVRRSLNYGLLSLALTLAYALALAGAELLLGSGEFEPGTPATLLFVFFGSIALLPLRDRLQGVVDRVFFRSAYDFRRVVERASERMASATDLRAIGNELTSAIGGALQCEWHALYVRAGERAAFQSFGTPAPDGARAEATLEALESATQPLAISGQQLAVPVRSYGKLVAAFLLGPRRSGAVYGDDDRSLLQTLANQASTAFQRAVVLERLRRMNRELEAHVEQRTKALHEALAELQEKNQQLTKLSVRDSLTDLYNRGYLDGVLEREFARAQRRAGSLTILMIDVDHFKRVNDSFGHPIGDSVLRRVAEVLQRNSRTSDVIGRYGGEEFMAILCQPDGTAIDATLPERLRREIEELRFGDSGGDFSVTVSIGVASYYPGCATVDDLVSAADVALYRAKRAGRNRVVALGELVKTDAGRALYLVVASQPADRDRLAELLPPHVDADALDPRSLTEIAPLVDACAALALLDGADGAGAIRALVPLTQVRAGSSLLLIVRNADALLDDALVQLAPREVAPHDAPIALLRHLAARLWDRRAGRGAVKGQRPAEALLGVSRAIRDVIERIELVALSRLPILILGETGTGKELVARAIHHRSERASEPFVAVNCGGLPESLLESELFGAERGAYTGADRARQGLFEAADGGTLFLDEIGEMPLAFQVKLLRVLETQEFRRVGATRTQRVDVRIVAATHRDLERAVKRGEFRQDLYFRINGATLSIPPLRRRRVDIPFLAQHFAEQFGEQNAREITLEPEFLDRLAAQEFPGNVRELRNAVERAIALSRPGAPLVSSALDAARPGSDDEPRERTRADARPLREQIAALEESAIRAALERWNGNRTRVARELGLSRLGLRQKMARLGIEVTESDR